MSGTAPARTTSGRRSRTSPLARLALCFSLALLAAPGVASAAAGSADPFFPGSGSPAYDVSHYDVSLAYSPSGGQLRATARLEATPVEGLSQFALDLVGLRVGAVTVDGADASFSQRPGKLGITPRVPLEAGKPFVVMVHYSGHPEAVMDPDGTMDGWISTDDGAAALSEPVGTATWLPCNNSLLDKASFSFHLTVPDAPRGLKAVANGRLLSVEHSDGHRTFDWSETEPMAPYLATVDIGRGRLLRSEISGLPAWTMVDPLLLRRSRRAIRALPEIIRFEGRAFGPYPFDAAGSVIDAVPALYDALETQTRPTYVVAPSVALLVHEMAHQWFGDAVGLTRWPEIWLNEGFATWAEWFYAEHHGGPTARRTFESLYGIPASNTEFWEPPSGHPGTPRNLFARSVYLRGGMALEALRIEIGTGPLLRILRRWVGEHRYGNATIPQFIALAEEVSGRQLDGFFDAWLYKPGKPPGYGAAGASR